jgi:hypothetical protein
VAFYAGNQGIFLPPVFVPKEVGSKTSEPHRLAVAWGLSHKAPDIGEITPAGSIPDIDPPRQPARKDVFVSKDQV